MYEQDRGIISLMMKRTVKQILNMKETDADTLKPLLNPFKNLTNIDDLEIKRNSHIKYHTQ